MEAAIDDLTVLLFLLNPPAAVAGTAERGVLAEAVVGGVRTFSRGSGGVARVTLEEAASAASKNGIDMKMFQLAYEPGPHFGFMSQTGSGAPWRAAGGRIVLTLQDAGLSSIRAAVETIAHELNHVSGIFATGIPTEESAAEAAGKFLR